MSSQHEMSTAQSVQGRAHVAWPAATRAVLLAMVKCACESFQL